MTIGETAAKLGINRVTLSLVINGRARITIVLALKLEAGGWGAADSWLRRQASYDLAQARKSLNQPPRQLLGVWVSFSTASRTISQVLVIRFARYSVTICDDCIVNRTQ